MSNTPGRGNSPSDAQTLWLVAREAQNEIVSTPIACQTDVAHGVSRGAECIEAWARKP